MNIFFLDRDPVKAAQMQCDKHVVKMVLETAQLLSGPFHFSMSRLVPEGIYKLTHESHPCARWVRQSTSNYLWLCDHGHALCVEYTHRYGRKHKCREIIDICHSKWRHLDFGRTDFTDPPQAMPEQYRCDDTVKAYRAYYLGHKSRFAKWEKGRKAPEWWTIPTR